MAAVVQGLAVGVVDSDASVRREAILGLRPAGNDAIKLLHPRMAVETDPVALEVLARTLTELYDLDAVPGFEKILLDPKPSIAVRTAAPEGLEFLNGAASLRARMKLVFDAAAPPALVAKALLPLGAGGFIPANDLVGFVYHKHVSVRLAVLDALNLKNPKSARTVKPAILDCLNDADPLIRKAACSAAGRLSVREAIPRLIELAKTDEARRAALAALCAMPDPNAARFYLAGLGERDAAVRGACQRALLAVRDSATAAIKSRMMEPGAAKEELDALERIEAKFTAITSWRVIGPFPRTTVRVFMGEPTIDFARRHIGAEGRTIAWLERKGDAGTGKVDLNEFKAGKGDRGGFGYDVNGSPDLCAFGYAEIESPEDREVLFLIGSSGTLEVTVNEKPVYQYGNFAGRGYAPDVDLVRADLAKGKNRVLVKSRQGIGTWAFGIRYSGPVIRPSRSLAKKMTIAELSAFAVSHKGDPSRGEEMFFDSIGIGCAKCHSVGPKGSSTIGPNLAGLASSTMPRSL